VLSLAASLAAVTAATPTLAQPTASDNETARQLLREGVKLRENGALPAAVEKLKGAHALVHTPVTGLELGKTYLLLNQLVEARDVFRDVVRLPEDRETDRTRAARAEAQAKAEELANRIPSLVLKLSGAPAPGRMTVRVDGEIVPPAALIALRKVNPGKHQVVVEVDGEARARAEVTLAEGETKEAPLALPDLPPPSAPAPPIRPAIAPLPERHFWGAQRVAGAVAGGVGLVGIGVGAAFGAVALSKNSQSNAGGHCHDGNQCDGMGFLLRQDARSAGTVSTAFWVAGGVVLAGGIALFLTAPSATGSRAGQTRAAQGGPVHDGGSAGSADSAGSAPKPPGMLEAAVMVGPRGLAVRGRW
jgi:hypothetical protein